MVSGNEIQGVSLAKKHWELHIDDIAAHVIYARVLFKARRLEESVQILEQALDMDKGNWEIYLLLGSICAALGREADARKYLKGLKFLADEVTVSAAKDWYKKIATQPSVNDHAK